ncbi:hypothetical protein Dsin_008113 [Dipteronia sinensis]|uniref:Uncharacterized protein n=1 Tax=Dipteronia sinensis TaxID=43782 RepID=A0AAE0B1E8_9ROSI|nr:hypothetical protein Dsin_008113 [Dipteronia sinensis]
MAVKRGILLVLDSGLVPFQVETDSLLLVNLISNGNLAAHTLAKMALSIDSDCYWLDDLPPCVERHIRFDASV